MKRRAGQAGRLLGRVLHAVGMLILTGVSLVTLLLFVIAFRLSMGPIQLPYLASFLATSVSGQGIDIHITQAALAWGGYRQGGTVPLYLRLGQISASNAEGVELASVPDARLVFLPGALLGSKAPILVNSADAHFAGSDIGVSLLAAFRLGIGFRLSSADLFITLGGGRLDAVPITGGGFNIHLTPHYIALTSGTLTLAPRGASAPALTFSGSGQLNDDWRGTLTLHADKVAAPDLGTYWPAALAAQTRAWVTYNITAGTATAATLTLGLSAPPDLSRLSLTGARGGFTGTGLALNWIPGARQITGLNGTLTVSDRDAIAITASSARLGGLALSGGRMTITGIRAPTQTAVISVALAGTVQDGIAVLNAPPLSLLRTAPPDLSRATGRMAATVSASLPLKNNLQLGQVDLTVLANLTNVAVPTPLQGLAFADGNVDLRASTTGLTAGGTANFAGQPTKLAAVADFTVNPALRDFTMQTVLGPVFLHHYGLDAPNQMTDPVTGTVPVKLAVTASGTTQTAVLDADLTPARLSVPVFGWAKAAGTAGTLAVNAALDNGAFSSLSSVTATAPGLDIAGQASAGTLVLGTADIGGTVAHGTITPASGTAPWRINLSGPRLSVRAILNPPVTGKAARQAAAQETPGAAAPSGPEWEMALDFTTFRLAKPSAPVLTAFRFTGGGKGETVLTAQASARSQNDFPVALSIVAAPAHRRLLHLTATDGGEVLRVIGAYDDLQGGGLDLLAAYGNGQPAEGTVTLTKFSVLRAPAFGKVLQGLTIYGVGEATSGPGLEFDHAIIPFSIARGTLTLVGARAYSASLGFTASGPIALADGACDLHGTIIPAYAINALPGKIPLVGHLFTAEKGGGLFALRVKVSGLLDDPRVSVNPLSALTPGVLRDVFGGTK